MASKSDRNGNKTSKCLYCEVEQFRAKAVSSPGGSSLYLKSACQSDSTKWLAGSF